MIRAFVAVLAIVALASCSTPLDFRGEEFSRYYMYPAEETSQERIERREVVHWKDKPADKKRVGFLYKYSTQVKGSRTRRESYYLYDWTGSKIEGFITAEGVFYKFDRYGRAVKRVGEYPILPTGLKMMKGYDLKEHVDLQVIDPYK